MIEVRRVTVEQAEAAATIHRTAGALIPGYDTTLHSPEEYVALYRDDVLINAQVWGAYDESRMVGFIALLPGWIDHLYVDPAWHRQGIGSRLIGHAQAEQRELRLYTFQSNSNGRNFYEKHGFVIEELTDGARNEEQMPDITYLWRAPA